MPHSDVAFAAALMDAIHNTRLVDCRNVTDYIRTFYARVLAWERVKAPWSLCDDVYQLWFLQGLTLDFESWKTTIYRTKNVGRIGSSSLPETSLDELCQLAADHADTFDLGIALQPQLRIVDTRRSLTTPSPSPSPEHAHGTLIRLKREHEESMMRPSAGDDSDMDTEEASDPVVLASRTRVGENVQNRYVEVMSSNTRKGNINNISQTQNTNSMEGSTVNEHETERSRGINFVSPPATEPSVIVEIRGQKRRLGMAVVRRHNGGLIPRSFTVPDIYNGPYFKACPLHGWQNNKKNHDEKTCHVLLNWGKRPVKRPRLAYSVDER